MSEILVNGQHLVLAGITGNAGDKTGVANVTVRVNVPSLAVAMALNPQDVAAAVGLTLMVCTDRPLSEDPDGEFTVGFVFEGFTTEITPDQAMNSLQVSFRPDKGSAPIQTLPKFKKIAEVYGPLVDGKFPETYTPKTPQGGGFSGDEGKNVQNPFFEVDNWIKYGGVFVRSYACTTLPSNLWRNIGLLVDFPPDADRLNIPHFKNRKWLKEAPDVDQSGNAYRVEEAYRLTGQVNGSEAIIYSEAQLSDG